MRSAVACITAALFFVGLNGCVTTHQQGPDHILSTAGLRDAASARDFCERGLNLVQQGDYDGAEQEFRSALTVDLRCAAAHNNLGLILLAKQRLYDSALRFSLASKLAPGATEPIINLGRVYETAGAPSSAITEYQRALAIDKDNAEAKGRLAYLYLKTGKNPKTAVDLLRSLVEERKEVDWTRWASAELSSMPALSKINSAAKEQRPRLQLAPSAVCSPLGYLEAYCVRALNCGHSWAGDVRALGAAHRDRPLFVRAYRREEALARNQSWYRQVIARVADVFPGKPWEFVPGTEQWRHFERVPSGIVRHVENDLRFECEPTDVVRLLRSSDDTQALEP